MGWIAYLRKHVDALSSLVNAFGIVVLMVLMLITVADVVLRYFFSMRIAGTYEVTEFTLVISVYLGIAYTMTKGGHVGVEVFVSRLPITGPLLRRLHDAPPGLVHLLPDRLEERRIRPCPKQAGIDLPGFASPGLSLHPRGGIRRLSALPRSSGAHPGEDLGGNRQA